MQPAEEIAEKLINNEWPNVSTWRLQDAYTVIKTLIESMSSKIKLPNSRSICRLLNANHHYDISLNVANSWIEKNGFDAEMARHKGQALINLNHLDVAEQWIQQSISTASQITPPLGVKEFKELKGLLCRIEKQRFVIYREEELLFKAIDEYLKLYDNPQYSDPCWHGVNAVALLCVAKRKNLSHVAEIRLDTLIYEIKNFALSKVSDSPDDIWSLATLPELFLASKDRDNAELWLYRLLDHQKLTPFVIGSFERQLKEIWEANAYSNDGRLASAMAAIIARHNDRIADFRQFSVAEIHSLNVQENDIGGLEKNFINSKFFKPDTIRKMLESCNSVGCVVGKDNGRQGTGFLLKGSFFKKDWGDELVFITNCHVISNEYPNALPADQASVIFDMENLLADTAQSKQYKFKEILFSSPPGKEGEILPMSKNLDVTILRLDSIPENAKGLPCANFLPIVDGSTRAFVIGHPNGSALQISLHDATILALDPKEQRLLHYRTPTEPGNSGSPVFNANWEVIAIHHAGSSAMPKLKTKPPPEFYEANEGVTIAAVRAALST